MDSCDNNAKSWKVYLRTRGTANDRDEYSVSYDVQWVPGEEWRRNSDVSLPLGTRIGDFARIRAIEPGKSILFSVPKAHLDDGMSILVEFSYEWELSGDTAGDFSIRHLAPFWYSDLPITKERDSIQGLNGSRSRLARVKPDDL